jgi:glycosyltransferase involved in cell wall biosynthesis
MPVRRCLLVFDPPDGGVAEHVLRLACGLERHGWNPTVFGPRESVIYPALERAAVRIIRAPLYPGYGHLGANGASLRILTKVLRQGAFDLLHAHNAKGGVIGRLAARATGVPAVYSPHCFAFVAPHGRARRSVATAVEWSLGRLTRTLICVADEERRQALSHRVIDPSRLRVVHNGAPPCREDLGLDQELERFRAEGPLAASLCVLREQKTVDVFLDAAPGILARVPEARLAVIGDGPLREALVAHAARLGLDHRLRFFPFRGPPPRQLASIDVFVLSSGWEAFPISIVEAMACGVPQVATAVGGVPEAVDEGETGYLCPPGDREALAERVAALLADAPLRERMSAASRDRFEHNFSLEKMVAKIAAVYDETLAG